MQRDTNSNTGAAGASPNGNGHHNLSEEDFAKLAGLSGTAAPSDDDDLAWELRDDEEEETNTEMPQTGRMWNNPFVKAGAVGTGLGVVFLVGAAVTMGMNYNPPPLPTAAPPAAATAEEEPDDPTGRYKTELALGKQEGELEAIKGGVGTSQSAAAKVRQLPPSPPPSSVVSPAPPPPRITQLPPPVQASTGLVVNQNQGVINRPDLSQMGSYGQIQYTAARGATAQSQGNPQLQTNVGPQDTLRNLASREEIPVLKGRAAKQLVVSTTAEGVIVKPLIAEGNEITTAAAHQQTTIELLADLPYDDGSIALPAGTQVVARLRGVSSNGFVLMVATSVIVTENGRRVEVKLPEDAIWVQGGQGRPLIASNLNDRGQEISSQDLGQFAAAGAQRGAELFNRATSQSAFSGIGGVGVTAQYPPINLLAGIIEGGAGALTGNLSSRSKQAIAAAIARPNIWFLPAKTPVQLIVNQSVELER